MDTSWTPPTLGLWIAKENEFHKFLFDLAVLEILQLCEVFMNNKLLSCTNPSLDSLQNVCFYINFSLHLIAGFNTCCVIQTRWSSHSQAYQLSHITKCWWKHCTRIVLRPIWQNTLSASVPYCIYFPSFSGPVY